MREQAFVEHRDALLADDANEPYSANFPKLDAARRWVDSRLNKYLMDNQITKEISPGEAIDIAVEEGMFEAFANKFSTLDFEKVVRMYESKHDFGKALRSVGNTDAKKDKSVNISNLKKLADKASNLSGLANQKAVGGELTLEAITSMTVAELEKLSDEDSKKIEKFLEGTNA